MNLDGAASLVQAAVHVYGRLDGLVVAAGVVALLDDERDLPSTAFAAPRVD